MGVNLRKIGEFCIVDLKDNAFTKESIEELKTTVSEIIDQGFQHILLNMTEIPKIDSIGLGALINLQKIALYHEVNIRIYNLQPYVAEIIFQTRLNRVLDICQTEEDEFFEEALQDKILIA